MLSMGPVLISSSHHLRGKGWNSIDGEGGDGIQGERDWVNAKFV